MPEQDEGYAIIEAPAPAGEEVAAPEPDPVDEPAPEPEPEPEPTPEEVEAKKKLTGSARAKAKAERLAEENRMLHERLARLEEKVEPAKPKPANDGRPIQEDYETHAEWVEALTDWKVSVNVREREQQAQAQKIQSSWEEKKEAARKDIPDLDEVLEDMETPAPVVVAVMAESEHTARIAYHLAQHPDELRKINKMSPPAAALAVARIEASLLAPPKPKPTTKAPAPAKPVQGGTAALQDHPGYEIY